MTPSFENVFEALHGHKPYQWQERLCEAVLANGWPKVIAAPTGAGKTAVIDIALFHLAFEDRQKSQRAPRRIVFAVDRRVVVDQAFERATHIARQLAEPQAAPLKEMRERLLRLGGQSKSGEPLHVEQLRGGLPREDDWARTPLQPTVLCTTVDQLGSRLLFRGYGVGYGVWHAMAPIHAGLLGNDTLIILDEAHLSAAFSETLERVEKLRARAEKPLPLPFAITRLTATPKNRDGVFELTEDEKGEEGIRKRLSARKCARLIEVAATKGRSSDATEENSEGDAGASDIGQETEGAPTLSKEAALFVEAAHALREELGDTATIAIVVNRVARARAIFQELRACAQPSSQADAADTAGSNVADVILLTGRVRPAERDALIDRYRARLEGRAKGERPLFVVATQCIEAGADFDFDGLVTQIAPLDALAQRFGRLARSGERNGKPAPARIIALRSDLNAKDGPVYGDRMKSTWEWLRSKATAQTDETSDEARKKEKKNDAGIVIDLGPNSLAAHIANDPESAAACTSTAPPAPFLRTADLDFWSMTNPAPHPDPHLPLYLHGDPRIETDLSIVWRADLSEIDLEDKERATEIIAAMLPRPGEALQLPIAAARALLTQRAADSADVPERSPDSDDEGGANERKALAWRGEKSVIVDAREIRPGDTLVVPASYGGCDDFGWIPANMSNLKPVADIADLAAKPYAKKRLALRLHPSLWPKGDPSAQDKDAPREDAQHDGATQGDAHQVTPSWSSILPLLAELPKRPQQIKAWIERVHAELSRAAQPQHASEGDKTPASALKSFKCKLKSFASRRDVRLLTPYGMREDEEAVPLGVVLVAGAETVETDDDDGSSFTGRPQALEEHVNHVLSLAETFANGLGLDDTIKRALTLAARHHDDGKRDPRFQDFLRAAAGATAEKIPADLAKSGVRASRGEERRLREAAGLPQPWRHEVLSAQLFAERYAPNTQQGDREMVDLALWLIGTHHGQGRPFFRHVDPWDGIKRKVGDVELTDAPGPHRLDFDWDGDAWADLFETLKRRYGYWGLAYLEAVLRLADHRASENLCQKNGRDNGGVNGTSKQS